MIAISDLVYHIVIIIMKENIIISLSNILQHTKAYSCLRVGKMRRKGYHFKKETSSYFMNGICVSLLRKYMVITLYAQHTVHAHVKIDPIIFLGWKIENIY